MRTSDNSCNLILIEGPATGITVPFLKDIFVGVVACVTISQQST